jgi:hypothetical protein
MLFVLDSFIRVILLKFSMAEVKSGVILLWEVSRIILLNEVLMHHFVNIFHFYGFHFFIILRRLMFIILI